MRLFWSLALLFFAWSSYATTFNGLVRDKDTSNCYSYLDTSSSEGFSLTYLANKDFTGLELSIQAVNYRLKWGLPCEMSTLVPQLLSFENSSLLLVRGNGFSFRELICFHLDGDSIKLSRFQTSRSTVSTEIDFYAWQLPERPAVIHFISVGDSSQRFEFRLPEKYSDRILKEISLYQDRVQLLFEGGMNLELSQAQLKEL